MPVPIIAAAPCKAGDLKPGDLFSRLSQAEWAALLKRTDGVTRQLLYICLATETNPVAADAKVCRITIADPKDIELGKGK